MADVRIVRGHFVPDKETVRKLASELQTEIRDNPQLRASLKRNPRAFLGSRGLPIDSQRELLREAGFKSRFLGDCTVTCITTACCFTCWFTDFGAVQQ